MQKRSFSSIAFLVTAVVFLSACSRFRSTSPSVEVIADPTHQMGYVDEQGFLQSMIAHHQEAVDASQYVLTHSENQELKNFAQKVSDDQTRQMTQMKELLKKWYKTDYVSNANYQPMMSDLKVFVGEELEMNYIQEMIDHHHTAIEMAEKAKLFQLRPETLALVEEIIATQQQEILLLENFLESTYSEVPIGS